MPPRKQKLDEMLDALPDDAPPPEEAATVDDVEISAPRSTFAAKKRFSADEVMTPRLVIAQGLSPEVRAQTAKVGEFLLLGHDPEQSVKLVIAGHTNQRRFVEQGQQKARCWSPDGVQGYGNPGTLCSDCPYSKWTDSGKKDADSGKTINVRPPCDEIDAFVAFSITHGMPVIWPLKGTAAKAARFLKTLSNGLGMGEFAVDVTTVGKQNGSRAWHEPVIKIDNEVTKDEARVLADIALGAVQVAEEELAQAIA